MGILTETLAGMEGVKKLARSQSIKLCEKLKIPVAERSSSRESVNKKEEEEEEDSATPTKLPILRSFHSVSKQISEKKQTNGVASDCRGLVQYEDLLTLLTCLQCRCLISPPVAQCRKGHLYCLSCKKRDQLSSCKICKQTFVDAPNQALEKMVGLIGLPCKYGDRGCTELIFLPSRLQHETLCRFRPTECQFQQYGCDQVFAYKDLPWHHKMCPYAHHPHQNVLPAMPDRKKGTKGAESGSERTETEKKDSAEGKVPLANGPSTVVTSPQDELTESGTEVNSKPQKCSKVSDDVISS